MTLAVCLAAAALLTAATGVALGILGYRRLDGRLLDLDDRLDEVDRRPPHPMARPTTFNSLYDRRPDENQ